MAHGKEKAPDEEQSEFNSAIATLMRIDKIKQVLIQSTLSHDYTLKYNTLVAYFSELVSVMDNKDDGEQKDRLFGKDDNGERIYGVMDYYHQYLRLKSQGRNPTLDIWKTFIEWEIELKNIEQKYGMNMPKRSDPRYAMGGR